ncbi:MAG: hypothetical protein JST80_05280 [Bdellovibrionales bacterium]|nr:hypothetical protein [Bdellovibrionales bacterium]
MLQILIIVFTAVFTFFSVAHADHCPHLEGHFSCPARHGKPAYDLVITQSGNVNRTVRYSWSYNGGERTEVERASQAGVLNDPSTYGFCRNKVLYLSPSAHDFSDSTRYFVNGVGDYVGLTFLGQLILSCKAAH